MNRDQIIAKWSAMTPWERDAWVAEVVFGWRRCDVVVREDRARTVMVPPDDDGRWAWAATYDEYGCPHWLPRYTEDIGAAWTVFEHNGVYGSISYMGDSCRAELWARWNPETGEGEYETAFAGEAPEAICLAAIIAKLVTEVAA